MRLLLKLNDNSAGMRFLKRNVRLSGLNAALSVRHARSGEQLVPVIVVVSTAGVVSGERIRCGNEVMVYEV